MILEIGRTWEFKAKDIVKKFIEPADITSEMWHWVMSTHGFDNNNLQDSIDKRCLHSLVIERALGVLKDHNNDFIYKDCSIGIIEDINTYTFKLQEYQIVPESEQDLWDFVKKHTKFTRR